MITQVAGIATVIWLGEKISEYGIGNGISLIIFAGIVANYPGAIAQQFRLIATGEGNLFSLLIFFVLLIVAIAGMVLVQQGERRIPVQYARKVVGRRVMGGQTTYIPLRVNAAGVIPVIFAVSVIAIPTTLIGAFPNVAWLQAVGAWFNPSVWQGLITSTVLVVLFTYFYTQISFDPRRISDNLREYGGFVPGVRPGQPTTDHLGAYHQPHHLVGGTLFGFCQCHSPTVGLAYRRWSTGVGVFRYGFVDCGRGVT